MANDKQPSFAERRKALENAALVIAETAGALAGDAKELIRIGEIVTTEVQAMAAAEKRFTERRADKRKAGR
jgi:hypothetical protein